MRVSFATLVLGTALLLTACSGGSDGVTLQRGRSASSARAPAATSATGSSGDPSTGSAASPSTPTPASPPADNASAGSDAGPGTTPAPAPAPAAAGSCLNPKCFGVGGVGGCKATDAAGDEVTMGCQGGGCGCFAGGQTTATFDGDITSADDAAQLFLLNCTCN